MPSHLPASTARSASAWALGHAAMFGRFADGDLASILVANPS